MIENLIENKDYKYIIYEKYKCNQNIDRIKFFKNETKNNKIKALSAGYHLDKETQIKTGGIFFLIFPKIINLFLLNQKIFY